MNARAKIYVAASAIIATLMLLTMPWQQLQTLGSSDWLGLLSFAMLAVASQALSLDVPAGGRKLESSVVFLPLLACIFLFPPAAAVITAATVVVCTQLLKRRAMWSGTFNVAQTIITIAIGSLLFHLLYDVLSGSYAEFIAFFVAVGALGSFNMMLASGLIAIMQQRRYVNTLQQAAGPAGGNLLYFLLASPIAIIAALLYREFHLAGVVLIVLPVLLVRYSYLSKVQLQAANEDLLKALVKAIETRDPYTSGHSRRVSRLATMIAEDLGLPDRKVQQIQNAALLHDIGKIDSLYVTMIKKTGPLDEEERRLINTHATKGAELLQSLSMVDKEVIRAVRHHHERYDGKGYPDGLTAEQIPIGARIIMVSDSLDAMLSDRPYRAALSQEQVESELRRCSGSQFDPSIVKTLLHSRTVERAVALLDAEREKEAVPSE